MLDKGEIKHLDFMRSRKVCFYNHGDSFRVGTILRDLADSFSECGVKVLWEDESEKPDAYIFVKVCEKTKYDEIKIIHAENLIGKQSLFHSYDNADAIVYHSNWLRQVYRNSFPTELPLWRIIPPAADFLGSLDDTSEIDIVCISKWWKRPYKRFPLIAEAFTILNTEMGFEKARLHVFGWLTREEKISSTVGIWPIVKLSRRAKTNPNIVYYQKSFHSGRDEYLSKLRNARLLIHLSVLDSGPQVVTEGMSCETPMVISNNMGGAEWMREVGSNCGVVLDLDEVTDSYKAIKKLPLFSRRLCSNIRPARQVAEACKMILENREDYRYTPPLKFRKEGTVNAWFELIWKIHQQKKVSSTI